MHVREVSAWACRRKHSGPVGVLSLRCSPALASCLSAHPWEHKGARNATTRSPASASSRPGGQNSSQSKALPRDREEIASIRPTEKGV